MIGQSINILRRAKRMSLSSLAARANISVSLLSLIESGQRDATPDVLKALSESLGIPPETLEILRDRAAHSDRDAQSLATTVRRMANAEQRLEQLLAERFPSDSRASLSNSARRRRYRLSQDNRRARGASEGA